MSVEVSVKRAETGEVARLIARTAARLFAQHGYDATSVRMIVEAAGVTKPTLYYHFKSKEGLAQALLTVPLTNLLASLQKIIASDDDPRSLLEQMFLAHFEFCREEPDRFRMYYAICFGSLDSVLAVELFRFADACDSVWAGIVGKLVDQGIVEPSRSEDLMAMCNSVVTSTGLDFLFKGKQFGANEAKRLVGDLLYGFAKPGHSGRGS